MIFGRGITFNERSEVKDEELLKLVKANDAKIHVFAFFRFGAGKNEDEKPVFSIEPTAVFSTPVSRGLEQIVLEKPLKKYLEEKGCKTLDEAVQKDEEIQGAFVLEPNDRVVVQYDRFGDEMSATLVTNWKRTFISQECPTPEELDGFILNNLASPQLTDRADLVRADNDTLVFNDNRQEREKQDDLNENLYVSKAEEEEDLDQMVRGMF